MMLSSCGVQAQWSSQEVNTRSMWQLDGMWLLYGAKRAQYIYAALPGKHSTLESNGQLCNSQERAW